MPIFCKGAERGVLVRPRPPSQPRHPTAALGTTHVDVVQLVPGRAPDYQVQHLAQVAHVDAALTHHLGQRGSVHGQHRVVCEVLHLRAAARQAPPAQGLRFLPPWVFPRELTLS